MINKDSDIEIIISKYLSKEAIPEEIKVLDDWISAAPENYHKRMCGKSVTRLLIRKR
jgi:transmembrane sensor